MIRFSLSTLVLTFIAIAPVAAAPPPAQTLKTATDVLDELAAIPLKSIPPALLADAQGVAIIPHVIKAGFIFGGRGGHGVVMVRDRNGVWGEPTFVNLGGASVGFQAGVESTDVVLVFRSRKSLDRLLEGKNKITLGVDAAVAAGPVGRQASAATDARLEAEIVSYSRSRGLFAGVALDGAAIYSDPGINAAFRRDVRPETAKLAETLKVRLSEMGSFTPPPGPRRMMPPPPFLGPPAIPVMPFGPPPVIPSSPPPVIPTAPPSPFAVPMVPSVPPPVIPPIPVAPGRP
ncbi:MAG TPA: lipid-binding SYLF domain-containing protein [Gemmata sp.]|jgi:lipid-binding SYLF domain-containing protein|nr:lipid-binding SYLF domain-containing protein [Gemmata sp.]